MPCRMSISGPGRMQFDEDQRPGILTLAVAGSGAVQDQSICSARICMAAMTGNVRNESVDTSPFDHYLRKSLLDVR